MKFIVYKNNIGYFVAYKDKGSDAYSEKWFDSAKYTNLRSALSRLGIELNRTMRTIDDFYKKNPLDKSVKRDHILSEMLEDKSEISLKFSNGFIQTIDEEGRLGDATNYILNYVNRYLSMNKSSKIIQTNYINNTISDEDFFGF